jgi:hypothetical protein
MNNDLHEAFNHLAYLCMEGKVMCQRNIGSCFVVDATNAMNRVTTLLGSACIDGQVVNLIDFVPFNGVDRK